MKGSQQVWTGIYILIIFQYPIQNSWYPLGSLLRDWMMKFEDIEEHDEDADDIEVN